MKSTVTIVGHVVAPGDVGILEQAADTHREGRTDHLVDVNRHALGPVRAERGVLVVEALLGRRLLGDDVDGAAGGAAAGERRGGPAQDFDLLGEEVLADADTGIADTVDEDVVADIEAADEEPVAEGVAALSGAERDASRRKNGRFQRGRVLVLQNVLAEDSHRPRRVHQLLGKLARRLQAVALVGRGRVRVGITVSTQLAGIWKRHGRGRARRALRRAAKRISRARPGPASVWTQLDAGVRSGHRPSPAGGRIAALPRSRPTQWRSVPQLP